MNGANQSDASQSKFSGRIPNLNLCKTTLFFANPWGIAFTKQSGSEAGYAISAGSDLLVKVNIAADGTLSFTGGPTSTLSIDLNDPKNPATSGFNAGKTPQGIAITDDGKTAYVANFVSRNISIVSLATDKVTNVIRTTALPAPGSKQELSLVGAEMFFSSRGHSISQRARRFRWITVSLKLDGRRVRVAIWSKRQCEDPRGNHSSAGRRRTAPRRNRARSISATGR